MADGVIVGIKKGMSRRKAEMSKLVLKRTALVKPEDIEKDYPDGNKTQKAAVDWDKCKICGKPINPDIGYCEVCEINKEDLDAEKKRD